MKETNKVMRTKKEILFDISYSNPQQMKLLIEVLCDIRDVLAQKSKE